MSVTVVQLPGAPGGSRGQRRDPCRGPWLTISPTNVVFPFQEPVLGTTLQLGPF